MDAPWSEDHTRRSFLGHVVALAVTGLAGAAIPDRSTAEGLAQGKPKSTGRRPQRVAVIGVDHYHATSTPNYLRILQGEHVDILGVHAPDAAVAAKHIQLYVNDYTLALDERAVHALLDFAQQQNPNASVAPAPPVFI